MAKTMWEKAYEKIENCGEKYREAKARGDYAMARFWGNAMRGCESKLSRIQALPYSLIIMGA